MRSEAFKTDLRAGPTAVQVGTLLQNQSQPKTLDTNSTHDSLRLRTSLWTLLCSLPPLAARLSWAGPFKGASCAFRGRELWAIGLRVRIYGLKWFGFKA